MRIFAQPGRGTAGMMFRLSLLALLGTGMAGCQLLTAPFFLWGQKPTREVAARFSELPGKTVCIVVWVEPEAQFEYPHVQWEIADHVRAALEQQVKDVKVVPTKAVVDVQRREPDWDRKPPGDLARRFEADYALHLEVTQYTVRDVDTPQLLRGSISAYLKLFDAQNDGQPLFNTDVAAQYPPKSQGEWGVNERVLRRFTMEAFALAVAKNFHAYKEEIP